MIGLRGELRLDKGELVCSMPRSRCFFWCGCSYARDRVDGFDGDTAIDEVWLLR